jgi:large subunit ribosomal protein L24
MARIRKDDFVEVISGNDAGKRGRVLRVIPDKHRVVVQGVNLRWKHLRKSQQNPQGGRVRRETAVHISNVMIYDEEAAIRTRVGYALADGKKVRVGLKTGQRIGPAKSKAKPGPAEAPAKKKTTKKKAAKKTAKKSAKKTAKKAAKKSEE